MEGPCQLGTQRHDRSKRAAKPRSDLSSLDRQLRERGRSISETIREGCDLRFRPLLMTALVSFIGHLPVLYATGAGADIQKLLAVVVMGGLITSTLLTLIVLPVFYGLFEGRRVETEM